MNNMIIEDVFRQVLNNILMDFMVQRTILFVA
jgi:hypothetical protein